MIFFYFYDSKIIREIITYKKARNQRPCSAFLELFPRPTRKTKPRCARRVLFISSAEVRIRLDKSKRQGDT